jgi:hypothetical protein
MPKRTVLAFIAFLIVGGPRRLALADWPRQSDVVMTSRAPHFAPLPGRTPYTTWTAATAFHATRLDWVYTTNQSFIEAAHARGLEVTTAMNSNLPDPAGAAGAEATYRVGRMENIRGEPITAPWMRAWKTLPYYGCINNPDYVKIAYDMAKTLIDIGSDGIQHDDPASNGEAVAWDDGNVNSSGCYCSHCMSKFTTSLLQNQNKSTLQRLNVTATWTYKQVWSLENGGHVPG